MTKIIELFSSQDYIYTKMFFQRALAFIYFIGFLIAFNQGKALIGKNGLTPARIFISKVRFFNSPSLFYLNHSDNFMMIISLLGIIVSIAAMIGLTEKYGYLVSIGSWFFLWVSYLSFVNIGQTWYGYGWESMLLETGFLAIFLGPANISAPAIVIWLLRWVCFRNMFGAGMIKLRGDQCWRDLTCMFYYYETQPIPNPLTIFFHRLPQLVHKFSVLFTFFAELIIPFAIFAPWWIVSALAGIIIIIFQSTIIISGNLAWLNYLSLVLCIPCFSDTFFIKVFKFPAITLPQIPLAHQYIVYLLGIFVSWKSWGPITNLISKRQSMNRSFDPLHLVNTYGAFGSITKERNELVVLGTMDDDPEKANWKVYEFKGKPTDINRMPTLMSPYEWKIDWQIWFAAFGDYRYSPWMLNFMAKLLYAQKDVLALIYKDPFNGARPKWIKVDYYKYKFQTPNKNGYWRREYLSQWLPPLNLENESLQQILRSNDWLIKK
jgi:hypothetical protein